MVNTMNAIYDALPQHSADGQTPAPDDALLRALAQTHLDTRFFRKELLHLQGEPEAAQRADALERELATLRERFDNESAALARERDDARARLAALVARVTPPLHVPPAPLRERVIRLGKRLLP